jgi:hypothetical protein
MLRIIMAPRAAPPGTSLLVVILLMAGLSLTTPVRGQELNDRARVTLDFNEVDLPVFIRYISELSGNHVLAHESHAGAGLQSVPFRVGSATARGDSKG